MWSLIDLDAQNSEYPREQFLMKDNGDADGQAAHLLKFLTLYEVPLVLTVRKNVIE